MKYFFISLFITLLVSSSLAKGTQRIPQIENKRVVVWQTIIYPAANQSLKMHRHDYDRVVVALSNGTLKIKNNQGKIHYLVLEKNKSYFLPKDPQGEFHTDENISKHAVKVIVINLK